MKTIPFCIVGYGRIGKRHAKHISRLAELKAVCDIDKNALKEAAEDYPGIECYNSIDSLLENDKESSVVNICTPNGLHAEQTVKALRNGRHVVCEKPMALKVKDAEKMIEEAEKVAKHLFIVKQNRFNPPVEKLKETMDKNLLGRIYSVQLNCFWNRNERYYQESLWKGTDDLDGGILFTQFSHFIDLLYWFCGDVEEVMVMGGNFNHKDSISFADTVTAVIRFKTGALGTVNCTINSFGGNMEGSITLFAEKGTVKIGGQYLNVLEYQNIENYEIERVECHRPANEYGYYQGSMSNHDLVIKNVIDVLNNDGDIATTGYEGLKTVEIIEKIYKYLEKK